MNYWNYQEMIDSLPKMLYIYIDRKARPVVGINIGPRAFSFSAEKLRTNGVICIIYHVVCLDYAMLCERLLRTILHIGIDYSVV